MDTPKYTNESIRTLTTLEDFRMNSSQYVGSGGIDTDCQLLKEIIDNSVDESIDPNKTYHIKLVLFTNGTRYQVAIIDHGRGIPCDKLKSVYTDRATSGKYNADAYFGVTIGAWGVGSKLTTALSRKFTSISKRHDGFAGITIEKGVVKNYDIRHPLDKDTTTQGTTVLYETDDTILTESDKYMSDVRGFKETLKLLEYITAFKPNTKFTVYQVDKLLSDNWFKKDYVEQWTYLQNITGKIVYQSPDNLTPYEYVRTQFNITGTPVWKLSLSKEIDRKNAMDTMGYQMEIGVVKDCEKQKGMFGIVNGNTINTSRSSHLAVIQTKLKDRIRQYLDEDATELKTFFDTQYEIPIHGYTSVLYKNAKFIGQTKDAFIVSDFARLYGQHISRCLDREPDDKWAQLYDLIVEDLQHKFQQATNSSFQTGKSLKNAAYKISRIGSFTPSLISNPNVTELLITEGRSAGGTAKQVRDGTFQAILMLGGKPINALNTTPQQLRKNEVYQDLIRLLGVGPGDKDLSNLNFKSIGLLADADPDGYHIITLLIGCIYKINPLILEAGKVWIANPPLYVYETKDTYDYLRDQKALDDRRVMIYEQFMDIHIINDRTGKTVLLEGSQFRDFVYLVKKLYTVMQDVASKLSISEVAVLEQLVYVVDYLSPGNLNCDKIKELLGLESCEYIYAVNSLLMVSGGKEFNISISRLVHEINTYILPVFDSINYMDIRPLCTTKLSDIMVKTPVTYTHLYNIFEEIDKIYPVRRIKGLGECLPEQLKYSCIDPATRTYTTIYNIGDVDKIMRLLGDNAAWRKELAKTQKGD